MFAITCSTKWLMDTLYVGFSSQSAARKLAEVLLSSVSEDSYWPPLGPPPSAWLHREGAAASKDAIYPTVKPPQRYSTDGSVDFYSTSLTHTYFRYCLLWYQRDLQVGCDKRCPSVRWYYWPWKTWLTLGCSFWLDVLNPNFSLFSNFWLDLNKLEAGVWSFWGRL